MQICLSKISGREKINFYQEEITWLPLIKEGRTDQKQLDEAFRRPKCALFGCGGGAIGYVDSESSDLST